MKTVFRTALCLAWIKGPMLQENRSDLVVNLAAKLRKRRARDPARIHLKVIAQACTSVAASESVSAEHGVVGRYGDAYAVCHGPHVSTGAHRGYLAASQLLRDVGGGLGIAKPLSAQGLVGVAGQLGIAGDAPDLDGQIKLLAQQPCCTTRLIHDGAGRQQ